MPATLRLTGSGVNAVGAFKTGYQSQWPTPLTRLGSAPISAPIWVLIWTTLNNSSPLLPVSNFKESTVFVEKMVAEEGLEPPTRGL